MPSNIGYVELRSEFRTDQSVAGEVSLRWSDAYSAATTLPVNCVDSRLAWLRVFRERSKVTRVHVQYRGDPSRSKPRNIGNGRSSWP